MDSQLVDPSEFNSHMIEGWFKMLEDKKPDALNLIQIAVTLNPRNVHALLLCAVLKCMLVGATSARENFESAAMLLESFLIAKAAGAYPYTSTANDVYERILGVVIPVALHRAPRSVLKGSLAVVKDEALVCSFAERLAARLPAYAQNQVDNILDQTVHVRVTFRSEIHFARETTSSSTRHSNGYPLKLSLKLVAVEFGVKGCLRAAAKSDQSDLLGYLVHDLRIVASPGESWKSNGTLSSVRPGDEHNRYPMQYTENVGYNAGLTVGPSGPPTATLQANYTDGRTVSSQVCGWVQSSKVSSSGTENDWESRWRLFGFKYGHKLALDKPVRKIRELPILDPGNVNYPSLDDEKAPFDATWTIPLDVAKRLDYKFDFKITVKVGVVLLSRWRKTDLVTMSPPKLPITDSVSFSSTIHCQYFDSVVELYHGLG